ncbi:glycoside hydrolase family 61 protein [Phanerochaete carnosa HHB-10118-sp]|uniref:lytic cellulose monooxygenase (C4-dehydrogenating) n=1 Tax=Phanerochaete carnosa (strain HHB-10118-sp) TaxID=650164 RepID=K5VKD6_PHACS|nr:glycoside hydrolase family 61 protein [Phanerochaete carnosa HHB-10118-sp]EKM51828.1 glycoside hydrolase family 61 protein [Phanerochaete carnosa HHB-10118-sp]
MMSFITLCVAFVFSLLPFVAAHGYVSGIGIDGQWYSGNAPGQNQGPSPIRMVANNGPVKGATNPDIVCGLSAQNAQLVVPANSGSLLSVQWSGGSGGSAEHWPHEVGPVMTYMAPCGSTPCNQFNGTGAGWFKINQAGLESDGSTWYQGTIASTGDTFDLNLPENLSPGGYLIRNELISLQNGISVGGAEFYPSCFQVMIGGNGNGSPSPAVSFPGAYSDTDPGIYVPGIYNGPQALANYTFPGGPVANLAATSMTLASPYTGPTVFPSAAPASDSAPVNSGQPTASAPAASGASGGPAAATSADDGAPPASATGAAAAPTQSGNSCSLKARERGTINQRRHFRRSAHRAAGHAESY